MKLHLVWWLLEDDYLYIVSGSNQSYRDKYWLIALMAMWFDVTVQWFPDTYGTMWFSDAYNVI